MRPLSGFVMVLSYSRAVFALFTVDQTLESFLRGHVEAFAAFPGVARTLVYDNLRSAVLERAGQRDSVSSAAARSSPGIITSPRGRVRPAARTRRGKSSGRSQYLRHAFFAARTFADVDDLNAQFRRWRDEVAHQRPHPEQRDRTVADVFAEEQPRLLPLPAHPFDTDVMRTVASGKTPYVRFDRNSYSIPHTHVRRPLTLLASATTVRLVAGTDEIARHVRSYDTGQTIEHEAHVAGLIAATRQANPSTARDRLRLAVPVAATLLERLAARGESLRAHSVRLARPARRLRPAGTRRRHRARARARRARRRRHRAHPRNAAATARPEAAHPDGAARSPRRPRSRRHARIAWRPTMTSLDPIPTTLSDQLRQLGLAHTASDLNDFIARATQKRWSPVVLLEPSSRPSSRPGAPARRTAPEGRAPRPLQADGRFRMGLADADPSADRRTRPDAGLSRPARERHRRRRARPRQDDDREESRPPGHPRRPLGALHHRRRSDPRSHAARDRPRPPAPPPHLHAAQPPRH